MFLYFKTSRQSPERILPNTEWVLRFFAELNWTTCKPDHLSASSVKVKNEWSYRACTYSFLCVFIGTTGIILALCGNNIKQTFRRGLLM